MNGDKRTALLTEIISPYRIPVFNAIAKEMGESFKVFFLGESEKRRHWEVQYNNIKFDYRVLPGLKWQKQNGTPYFFNPTIVYHLWRFDPEVIIVGGLHHPSYLLALLVAKFFNKRLVLWGESNKHDQRTNFFLKEKYKRWLVKNCTEYIVPGVAAFEYLASLGALPDRIWVAPNAVDNRFFTQGLEKVKRKIGDFKEKKGYPDKIILYVGRLIDEKGILDLLNAFQNLSQNQDDIGLVLVGTGANLGKYKKFCENNSLKNAFFEGFVPQKELPNYYAASDVFVLPTHSDPWGLVLNEAMACGLPVISSDVAGAARDLIHEGKNGYVYPKGDVTQLEYCIQKVLNGNTKEMGSNSFEIVQNFSPEKCAQGFLEVIKKTENDAYSRKEASIHL